MSRLFVPSECRHLSHVAVIVIGSEFINQFCAIYGEHDKIEGIRARRDDM